jgi:uncharacterized protein (DUF983 family)
MNNLEIVFAMAAALVVLAMLAGLGVVLAIAMAREDGIDARSASCGAPAAPRVPGRTLLWRAIGRRCPRCGGGRVFHSYFKMNPRCLECGAVFWVDQGEWLGPFVLDYSCATGAAIVVWAMLELMAPQIGEAAELALLAAVVIASLFATFPWSRSLWTVFLYISGAMGERPIRAEAATHAPRADI